LNLRPLISQAEADVLQGKIWKLASGVLPNSQEFLSQL